MSSTHKFAVFGAGCFWGVESAFRAVEGVVDVAVGYAGGIVPKPNYRTVCGGKTGHAEVVQVEYDPARVSFEQLLEVFWQIHDPTTLNRQGPDVGTQYRSIIFYSDENERKAAEESKRRLDRIRQAAAGPSSRRLCPPPSSTAPRNIISATTSGWVSRRPAEYHGRAD